MMYSPGGSFIMVAPVVTSWAIAGQRMVFLHMYLQTRVTLKAFPVATPRGRSSSSHEGEQYLFRLFRELPIGSKTQYRNITSGDVRVFPGTTHTIAAYINTC